MKNYFSITHKITLNFILVGIGACLVLGFFLYYSSRDAMLNRTFDQLVSVRTEKENRLAKFLSDRLYDVQLMSSEEETHKLFHIINEKDTGQNSGKIYLEKSWMPYHGKEYFSHFYFLSKSDSVPYILQISSDKMMLRPVSDNELILQLDALSKRTFSGSEVIDFNKNVKPLGLKLINPVNDDGKRLGLLVAIIPAERINEIMFEDNPHNGLGNSGEAYLVGGDYLMRSTSRFKDSSVLSVEVKTHGVKQALSGKKGVGVFSDYRGVEVLSSFSPFHFGSINWAVLAEIDLHEAMVPINDLRNKILLIVIIIGILVFVLAWFLSGWLSKPIVTLNRAAASIAEGKQPPPLAIKSRDEIGELTASFNHMSAKIEEQKQNLRLSRYRSLHSMIDGQEKERQRLSRELHDSLGQMLIALKLKYQSVCEGSGNPELLDLLDKTIEEARRMSEDLKPAELDEFGLESAMHLLCQVQAELTGIDIKLHVDYLPESIGKNIEVYLYRILQEALHNVHKHAEARKVDVFLTLVDDVIMMQIQDDGKGFNPDMVKGGNHYGLNNIEDRVSVLGGTFLIESIPQKGTTINIKLPIKPKV
ncbi:MAG: HAMP domain-containing protein [Bacteroidales bacterium]